jgi:hypothetical protein
MKSNLKISLKSHFNQSWPLIIYLAAALVIPFYFSGRYEASTVSTLEIWGIGLFFFMALPMLLLHLRYFLTKKIDEIYCPNNKEFILRSGTHTKKYKIADIVRVDMYFSISAYHGGFRVFPSDNYFYGIITFTSGEPVVVTTLIDAELLWLGHLCPNKTMKHKLLYCWC